MKIFFSFLLAFSFSVVAAQKKELLFDYAWKPTEEIGRARYYTIVEKQDSLWLRNDYYIREKKLQMIGAFKDENLKVGHGKFVYYYPNGKVETFGFFENGKKEGLWYSFHENGALKDSSVYQRGKTVGTTIRWHKNGYVSDSLVYSADGSCVSVSWFENGNLSSEGKFLAKMKRDGRWKFFHKNGQLSSVEDYQNGNLLDKKYYDEKGLEVSDTTSKDRQAEFPGGAQAWKKYIKRSLYFPKGWNIDGADNAVVVVNWCIDEEGNVTDVVVSAPFHPEFDKIAVAVIANSPKWIPAISHNRKVKAYRKQPITFVQW